MPRQKKSPAPYLATGFRDVDGTGDTSACTRCLDLLSDIPFFHGIKQESFRIVAAAKPELVLDAGCGAGNDLATLAGLLPKKSRVMGIDASAALLSTAAERTASCRDRCDLVRGDLLRLPFATGTFGACRIDRVLQHIHNPAHVVEELVRVLAPGGTLVAFDNDWDTLAVGLGDEEKSALITRSWSNSFASGRVGKDLDRIFRNTGLVRVSAEPRTLALTNLALAEKVYDLPALLSRMRDAGIFSEKDLTAIRKDLESRARAGTFTSGYSGWLVVGVKPE
jgi:Methylase involved in ubiquinone/menaquinone biosynthesis